MKTTEPTTETTVPEILLIAKKLTYAKLSKKQKEEIKPYIKMVSWKQEHYDSGPAWIITNHMVKDEFMGRMTEFSFKVHENWQKVDKMEKLAKELKVEFYC